MPTYIIQDAEDVDLRQARLRGLFMIVDVPCNMVQLKDRILGGPATSERRIPGKNSAESARRRASPQKGRAGNPNPHKGKLVPSQGATPASVHVLRLCRNEPHLIISELVAFFGDFDPTTIRGAANRMVTAGYLRRQEGPNGDVFITTPAGIAALAEFDASYPGCAEPKEATATTEQPQE